MKNNYSRLKWVALIILGGIFFFLSKSATAATTPSSSFQQQEISGVVQDQKGQPIPGVTITAKNTTRGAVTNLDGEYEITAPANATLVFSYIGFKTFEIAINGRSEINIQMEEDIASLGEVKINAGYYNTTERERTGNISRVTAEEIELQPVVSPIQALQGRMAGVEVVPNGNLPGNASTIRIRGTNSLREEGNYPLYIIDGVPVNSTPIDSYSNLGFGGIDPLNNLNVSNIESIEVLKDADATAIYGSRGANGVILISTKKGRAGETELQARVYTGTSTVPNRVDLLNTEEYLQLRRRAFENDGEEPTERNAYDLVVWDQDRYTDWQELFFGGTAQVTDVNLNASGGNENTTYRLSGSYHKQGTVFIGDYDYNKITAGAQLSHTSDNKKLNINLSLNYGVDTNNLSGYLDLSSAAFQLPPNAPKLFNEDGSLHWEDWSSVGQINPLEGYFNNSITKGNNLNSNLMISYLLAKGLEIKTNFGYSNFDGDEIVKRPKKSFNPSNWERIDHRSTHRFTKRNSWIIEPQINYSIAIGLGQLDALIGSTFQQGNNSNLGLYGEGYVSESLIGNLYSAEEVETVLDEKKEYRYNAIFARLGFNWDKKYYINLTGRRDGSSRFGPGKRISNFGAIGTAWIFSEENFVKKHLSFLSFGKFRVSYGTTGNDQIADYGYLDTYEATLGVGGLYPTQLANPDYSWEENKKLEAALHLGFFKDRINMGVSWFRNRSSNQLVGYPLPSVTGFSSVQANLPATVQNMGVEIEVSTYNFKTSKFNWQTSFNLTIPRNELVAYPGIEQSSYANTYKIGHPLNISFLYEYEGLDPENGLYKVRDVNEDGVLSFEDQVIIQDQTQQFFGGINNNITYKNFSLQFLFQFVKQEGRLGLFNAGLLGVQRSVTLDALSSGSRYQRLSQTREASRAYADVLNSTYPITDASFLRLKTFSLNYTLPENVLKSIGMKTARIFLTGQNLLTFTSFEGMDPEAPLGGTSFRGLRTITGGLQFNL